MTVEKRLLCLLSKKNEIKGKDIIMIFKELNYAPSTIRNVLTKLKKRSYITVKERGLYSLTTRGLEFYKMVSNKENFYHEKWDQKWFFVFMEIPEILRRKRETFRNKLLGLGFGNLYNSVYIYPWDKTDEVLHTINSLEIEDYVTITVSHFILNKINPEGIKGANQTSLIWNIEELHFTYKEKHNWLENEYKPEINQIINSGGNTLSIFTHYLLLQELKDELIEKDPMLPPEFLPESWVGSKVLDTIDQLMDSLNILISKGS